MQSYNKLVRDRIPEIIAADGDRYEIRILEEKEYIQALEEKALEEFQEYREAKEGESELEELADLLEVIYALSKARGYSSEELESARKRKAELRGAFSKRIFLIDVKEGRD